IPISPFIRSRPSRAACGLSGSTTRGLSMPPKPTLAWCRATYSAGKRNVCQLSMYVRAGLLAMGVACAAVGLLLAAELPRYSVEDRRSGSTYLSEENQQLQDDDFANPGLLWVERGRDLWQQTDGANGASCGG